ncbi:DUF397 domain-containing protein [Embleya sp. AB8]|uniref:DUF397 domain-containing protein n=1 Tax=Embleya sp. AB8 TaxID=3156304 RepID=UPI003C744446
MSVTKAATSGWVKSSRSNNAQNCVETKWFGGEAMAVRDSKRGDESPVHLFGAPAWTALVTSIKG